MAGVFIVLSFGFPAVFVSLLVSAISIRKDKFWLGILGAILFIPFSYHLNGAAYNNGLPFLLPLFQILSTAAVHERNKRWGWILLMPSFLVTLYVLGVVLFFRSL